MHARLHVYENVEEKLTIRQKKEEKEEEEEEEEEEEDACCSVLKNHPLGPVRIGSAH